MLPNSLLNSFSNLSLRSSIDFFTNKSPFIISFLEAFKSAFNLTVAGFASFCAFW